MAIIFAPEAASDLDDILLYTLITWGEEQQERYADLLDKGLARVQEKPDIGKSRPELYPGCFSYRIQQHIVYYAVRGEDIHIARLLHVRMDAKRYL